MTIEVCVTFSPRARSAFAFRNFVRPQIRFLDFPLGSGILLHFVKKNLTIFTVVLFLLPLGQVFASLSLPQTFVLTFSGWGTLCHGALRKNASPAFRLFGIPLRFSLRKIRFLDFPLGSGILLHFAKILRFFLHSACLSPLRRSASLQPTENPLFLFVLFFFYV